MQETIAGMEAIRSKVGLSAMRLEEMGVQSDDIGAIVETIEDIASQTNLLELNAAIEAAQRVRGNRGRTCGSGGQSGEAGGTIEPCDEGDRWVDQGDPAHGQ